MTLRTIKIFLLLCTAFVQWVKAGGTGMRDTLKRDSVRVDTLREVIVRSDSLSSLKDIIKERMDKKDKETPKVKTLGDILQKYAPGVQDRIVHPLAFKERRHERQLKRTKKVLEHFDQVKTFKDLLDEAVARQQAQDEMEQRKKERDRQREEEEDY